jgi:hypothetical protein
VAESTVDLPDGSKRPEPGPQPAEAPRDRADFVTRLLWSCAGADGDLLERCPHSDSVKYQGMGGVVLATAVLAFASGSYAFYTVFEPKTGTALGREMHVPTMLLSVIAGLIWGLVIFNLDRFIVSSTGKGDGTERILFSELTRAFPRIVMAVLLGVCISAPLEIRVLKPEIDAALELEQNRYLSELNAQSDQRFAAKNEELRKLMSDAMEGLSERESYLEKRRAEINEQRRSLEAEAEGRTKSGVAGRGPAWQDKRDTLDQMMAELERDRAREAAKAEAVNREIEHWKSDLASLDERVNAARESNLKQARHLDGLMKRIQISHEIGGWVPTFILLLLLSIETGPIFFKMMLRRGAYEYLQEAEMRLATARAGIEVDAQIYAEGTREEVRVDVYHHADAAVDQVRRRLAQSDAKPADAERAAHVLRAGERS